MKITVILFVALMFILTSCSTSPVSYKSASPIPSDRIYKPSYIGPAIDSKDATMLFLRDSGFLNSGCGYAIYIDLVRVFEIRHGEQITVHVPAGAHNLHLEVGGGLCPERSLKYFTTIVAGERAIYRIYPIGLTKVE